MTLRQVEVFCAVAKHESIKEAAKELGITSGTISAMMSQLQDSLGRDLLTIAARKGSPLTNDGREFYRAARPGLRKIMRVMEEIKGSIR